LAGHSDLHIGRKQRDDLRRRVFVGLGEGRESRPALLLLPARGPKAHAAIDEQAL